MSGAAMWTLPMKLPSCANLREHWAVRAKRMKQHRFHGAYQTRKLIPLDDVEETDRIYVLIVRHGVRKLDSDNLASAAKGLRDGIADALDIDDGSERIQWSYEQQTCRRGAERVTCLIKWFSENAPPAHAVPAWLNVPRGESVAPTASKKRSAKRLQRTEVGR